MRRASFRMADDDGRRSGTGQHFGGDIAGMGAARLGMTILAAKKDARPFDGPRHLRQQRRRRTNHDVDGSARRLGKRIAHRLRLAQLRREAVHLPVAGNKRADGARGLGHRILFMKSGPY